MALRIGSILAGRYEITAPIATGGMGEVWQATDRTLGRTVAAKVLKSEYTGDKNFLERFRNEARHTAGLTHANIASVYDYGEVQDDDGRTLAFLVMEYVEGEPLVAILDREITLSPERTLDVLAQAGDGLSAAHRAGVVHRDIKPGNLMVRPDGVVKLTDFGIAWARDAAPLTRTGMVVGTAQYLSPEQAQGFRVTAASDVYSLGILGYECLAGHRPFDGDSQVAIALAQINRPPPPLPAAVPSPVRSLVEKALSKDPAARFADGGAFADAARRIAAGGPGPETSAATAAIPVVGGGSTQLVGGGAGAAAAAAAAAAAGSVRDTAPRTMPPLQGPPVDEETDGWDDDEPRRRSPWPWVAVAAVVLLVLGAVLAFTLLGGDDDRDGGGGGTTTTTPATTSAPPTTTAPSTTAAETTAEETTGGEEEPTEEPGEETTQAPPPATTTQAPPPPRTTSSAPPPPATTTAPTTTTTSSTAEDTQAEGITTP